MVKKRKTTVRNHNRQVSSGKIVPVRKHLRTIKKKKPKIEGRELFETKPLVTDPYYPNPVVYSDLVKKEELGILDDEKKLMVDEDDVFGRTEKETLEKIREIRADELKEKHDDEIAEKLQQDFESDVLNPKTESELYTKKLLDDYFDVRPQDKEFLTEQIEEGKLQIVGIDEDKWVEMGLGTKIGPVLSREREVLGRTSHLHPFRDIGKVLKNKIVYGKYRLDDIPQVKIIYRLPSDLDSVSEYDIRHNLETLSHELAHAKQMFAFNKDISILEKAYPKMKKALKEDIGDLAKLGVLKGKLKWKRFITGRHLKKDLKDGQVSPDTKGELKEINNLVEKTNKLRLNIEKRQDELDEFDKKLTTHQNIEKQAEKFAERFEKARNRYFQKDVRELEQQGDFTTGIHRKYSKEAFTG